MAETTLQLTNNLGHNVLALREQAQESLVALANLYYHTQVKGQHEGVANAPEGVVPV